MPSRMYVPLRYDLSLGSPELPAEEIKKRHGISSIVQAVWRLIPNYLSVYPSACGGGPQCEQRCEEHDPTVEPRVGGECAAHVGHPLGALGMQRLVRRPHDQVVERLKGR
eukprot:scaffold44374_cov53-Phaeocystis_antarctica.AAC.4